MTTRLLFTAESGFVSMAIRVFTWSDYSHVELVREGMVYGADASSGVTGMTLEKRLSASSKHAFATTPADPEKVWTAVNSQLGKPYDWADVFGVLVHHDWQATDKWMCSELIAWAHLQAGVPLINVNTPVNRVTPQDLLESPLVLLETA